MKALSELKRILEIHKDDIKENFKVKEIGIFGSYLRGEMKETSDLDILVEFENDTSISLIDFIKLENYLSELLGVKVDLVDKESLRPTIGKTILREVVYI
ncbi:MAG: nucleotidyltransferase family protein [Thermoplasmata archaeon]